jgi:hypothetical protein
MIMTSSLDAFREQREAVEQLHLRLIEVGGLIGELRKQVDLLVGHKELRAVLQQEESWLYRLDRTIVEVRRWREEEAQRFWPGVTRRWILALAFAVAAAAAAGAGYAGVTQPYVAELAALRSRVEFADALAQRVITMTPSEHRQFDALMRSHPPGR